MSSLFPHVDRSGELVGDRYRLIDLIDRGGQGAVYRARDERAGDEVAVKVLQMRQVSEDSEWRERMLREAHALTVLSGTSAVQILHQASLPGGAWCLVMELLRGADLEGYLRGREERGQQLSAAELVPLFDPIVHTLTVAHASGIVHRDLKPGNIFVQFDGSVRLLDFGFAKFLRMRALTAAGFVAGSPNYISPEGWKGKSELLDSRVDVYGLAAVIFRSLTRTPPFYSDDVAEVMRRATSAERPSLHALRPDLPKAIDDWSRLALAIKPAERFATVGAMWNALRHALG
jgi:serine/threonine-protein kinase